MSVFPPGATNWKVPPCATASRPALQPVTSHATTAARTHSRRMSPDRRLAVGHVDETVTVVDQGGHRTDGALAPARVVPETLTGQRQPHRPDRELVADAHRFVAGRPGPRLVHRGLHPVGDL